MLMLGNQTIPVKIPPDLNNGEYLEALEVFKLPKVTDYVSKLPDSYKNAKVLLRVKSTFKWNWVTNEGVAKAGLIIGEKGFYPIYQYGYWSPTGTEHEKFFIDTLGSDISIYAYSRYGVDRVKGGWYVEADIYRIV